MKTPIDLDPLYRYVTREVSPFYLIECIQQLTLSHIRMLLAEVERDDPASDITARDYTVLYEINQVSACLLKGLQKELEPEQEANEPVKMRSEKIRQT